MIETVDSELLTFLRDTPGQPIAAPPHSEVWDAPKLIRRAQRALGGELAEVKTRLDSAVVLLGGGRQREVFSRDDEVGRPPTVHVEESYWVDKHQLCPDRYPVTEGRT